MECVPEGGCYTIVDARPYKAYSEHELPFNQSSTDTHMYVNKMYLQYWQWQMWLSCKQLLSR